jgi:hypothetical protein
MSDTYFDLIPDELILMVLGTLKSMKDFENLLSILNPRFTSKIYLINLIRQVWPYEIPNTLLNSEEINVKKVKYLIGLLLTDKWKIIKDRWNILEANVSDNVLYSDSTSVEKLEYMFKLIMSNIYNFKNIRNNITNYSLTLPKLITLCKNWGIQGYTGLSKQKLTDLIMSFLDEYGLGLK